MGLSIKAWIGSRLRLLADVARVAAVLVACRSSEQTSAPTSSGGQESGSRNASAPPAPSPVAPAPEQPPIPAAPPGPAGRLSPPPHQARPPRARRSPTLPLPSWWAHRVSPYRCDRSMARRASSSRQCLRGATTRVTGSCGFLDEGKPVLRLVETDRRRSLSRDGVRWVQQQLKRVE
jgi:hypothetical protein